MVNTQVPLGAIDTHYGGKVTETVKIKSSLPLGFAVIDKASFDPAKHELFSEDEGENRHGEKESRASHQFTAPQGTGSGESGSDVGNAKGDCSDGGIDSTVHASRGTGSASERSERNGPRSGVRSRYASTAKADERTAGEGGEGHTEAKAD